MAQNFLRDPNLVASIVSRSSIVKTDVVYEIGPGAGIITRELAKVASKVISIEQDSTLVRKLRGKLEKFPNIEVHQANFLDFDVEETDYKIFSNIPFNITSDIIRKVLFRVNPPKETYLFMQKEAAKRFSGIPQESQFSVLAKPFFKFNIIAKFRENDFEPKPSVEVVLLHIEKRDSPLVTQENVDMFRRFVKYGFGVWKDDLKSTYKRVFTYKQWKRLSKDIGYSIRVTPTQLTFEQWLRLFELFLIYVPDFKKSVILDRESFG